MSVQFGVFEIDEEGICINLPNKLNYKILKKCLAEVQQYRGRLVWHWPLMMTTKPWLSEQDIMEFNTAFFFALDYFSEDYQDLPAVSMYRTLMIQKKLINNRNDTGSDCLEDLQRIFSQPKPCK